MLLYQVDNRVEIKRSIWWCWCQVHTLTVGYHTGRTSEKNLRVFYSICGKRLQLTMSWWEKNSTRKYLKAPPNSANKVAQNNIKYPDNSNKWIHGWKWTGKTVTKLENLIFVFLSIEGLRYNNSKTYFTGCSQSEGKFWGALLQYPLNSCASNNLHAGCSADLISTCVVCLLQAKSGANIK